MTPTDLATEDARDAARWRWLVNIALTERHQGWSIDVFFTGVPSLETFEDVFDNAMGDMSPTHLQAPDMSPKG